LSASSRSIFESLFRSLVCLIFSASLHVFAAPTTTTLAITSTGGAVTTVPSENPVTLIATVNNEMGEVTSGRVNFCDATATYCADIHLKGTAQLTNAGTASITFFPGLGNHSYKAIFLGTSNNSASSSSPGSLTVSGKLPTSTTIAQSGTTNNYTLTATTTGIGSLTSSPTGTISFIDSTNANQVLAAPDVSAPTPALNFVTSSSFSTDSPANLGVTADFNGDGKADIAISAEGAFSVLLGNGDGTFTVTAVPPAALILPLASGDFNEDGKIDLVVANSLNSMSILFGNGDGTFTAAANTVFNSAPSQVVVDDFNNDGHADLAVVIPGSIEDVIIVFLGNGDGTFTTVQPGFNPGHGAIIATGDFNKDGKRDIFNVASASGGEYVYLGNGDGTFTPGPNPNGLGLAGFHTSAVVADFNGDGIDDIAFTDLNPMTEIYLGKGDATFVAAPVLTLPGNPLQAAVGDFNGDGKADLSLNCTGCGTYVLLGHGDGTFTPQVASSVPNSSYLLIADVNDDGNSDTVLANSGNNAIASLISELTETVTATVSNLAVQGQGTHAVLASYSGDANYTSSASAPTSLVATTATSLTLSANPNNGTYLGEQTVLTATLTPASAQGQTSSGESITFYNDTAALGTAKLSNGVATLSFSLPQGQNSLKAVYSGDSALGPSTSNTVAVIVNPSPAVTVSATPTLTVPQSGSATDSLILTPSPGYVGTVQFRCNNLPTNATCSFSPASITFAANSPASVVVTIQTGVSIQAACMLPFYGTVNGKFGALAAIIWMPGLFTAILPFSRRIFGSKIYKAIPLLVLCVLCTLLTACSGGSSPGPQNIETPPGTYTIQLVISGSNGLSQNAALNVTVQ